MRNLLKFLFISVIVAGGLYLAVCIHAKDSTDQFSQAINQYNFLVKRESRYVKIDNTNAKDKDGYGNYYYNLVSYDDNGNPHKIEFMGMGKLKQNHYLKLDTKGSYVYTYKEVFEKNIPSDVYTKLNTQ
ncbi:YxeA family protein [Companilactobacillus keshanensis]|uniref:YxeA family protein n=1 Tax=Companilactobacillus keshanensis TaxID=2486003 RepID=A0ABW4BRY6_9LACO|nr:YxeA family protein [Companilactobacillus keshanensis]